MVTEKHTIVAKKGDVKLEIIKEGFEKKEGDWTSVATRLLALCGGLEQYDGVQDMGLSAQERRRFRTERSGSLPGTPELARRFASSTFSGNSAVETRTLPRLRSHSTNLLSLPPMRSRARSFEKVNFESPQTQVVSSKAFSTALRTTTL